MSRALTNGIPVADGDGGSSPPAMPDHPAERQADRLTAFLDSLPSIAEQITMYRASRFDELAKSADWGLFDLLKPKENTPIWQVRLLSLDEDERSRIIRVCDIIEAADSDILADLTGTLRDSIVRNGTELIALDEFENFPTILVRFAIFFTIEKFRLAGLSRKEAIDCISRMGRDDARFLSPSAPTITAWYDKKSGIEYTGVKQLAELIVCKPQKYVFPIWAVALRALRANLDLIKQLVDLGALSDVEKAELKKTARWLLRLARIFQRVFGEDAKSPIGRRVETRLASLDSDLILRDVLPLLLRYP